MILRKVGYILTTLSALTLINCAKKSSSDSSTGGTTTTPGAAIQTLSSALGSISNLASSSFVAADEKSDVTILGGVANTYCNANSAPISSGSEVANTADAYAGQTGFCQATHNSQSPDSARGALYLSGAIACIAGNAGLFTTPGASTTTITIDTTCFGTAAEAAAMVSDVGSSSIPNVTMTVTAMTAGHPYDYSLAITGAGNPMTVYIKASNGVLAALMDTSGAPWAVSLDESTGILHFEGINVNDKRRMRIRVAGTYSNGSFTAVTDIAGFWMQGSSSSFSTLTTFKGNLTAGILGNTYRSDSSSTTDKCYLPGGSGTCSGITAIASSTADGNSLYSTFNSAATSLVANSTATLSFSTVDPSDTDILQ